MGMGASICSPVFSTSPQGKCGKQESLKIYSSFFDFLRQRVYNRSIPILTFRQCYLRHLETERMNCMTLPDLSSTALILEGGGFRGLYTTGVLDYFMEQGLYLPQVYGISAGALNAIGYAAKQPGRNAQINFRFCNDKRYISAQNMLKYRCAFNMEFIFDTIPEQYLPFDYDTFFSSEVQVHVGATNLLTGRCDFFDKSQMDHRLFPVRASAALPLFSHIFYLNGTPYLDGGIACPIPLAKAMQDGSKKQLIIMTKLPNFERKPASNLPLIRRVYREYPHFIYAEETRHIVDCRQRNSCVLLSKTHQALILQPHKPIHISAMRADEAALRELYAMGYDDAKAAFPQILEFLAE